MTCPRTSCPSPLNASPNAWVCFLSGDFCFEIAGTPFPLTPDQYIIPQAQYGNYGLSPGKYYSWIADGGADSTSVDFIIGQKFMENYVRL